MKPMIKYTPRINKIFNFVYLNNAVIFYSKHNHSSTFTINFVLKGTVILSTLSQTIKYEKNQFFIIPPYQVHTLNAIGAADILSLCLDKKTFPMNDACAT